MKHFMHIIVILAFFCQIPSPVKGTERNFLQQSVESARESNPELLEMQQALKNTEAGIATADAQRYPVLKTRAWASVNSVVPEMVQPESVVTTPAGDITIPGKTTKLGDYDRYGIDLELSHLFYAGGRLNGAVDMACHQVAVMEGQLAVFIRNLDRDVSTACLDLLRLDLLKSVTHSTLTLARNHADDIRNLESAGTVTGNEVLKAELRINEAETGLLDIQHRIELQTLRLRILTGREVTPIVNASSEINISRPVPDPETSIEQALSIRPELRVINRRIAITELSVDLIHREKRPVVSGFARASYGKPGPDFLSNQWIDSYSAGLNCSLTLWDFNRVDSRVYKTRGEIERLRLQRLALESAIDLEVTRAILGIESAYKHRDVADRARGQAEENFRITADGFKEGTLTNTDYLDAEIALDKARTDAVIQQTRCRQAWIDYHLALGTDLLKEGLE